MKTTNDSMKHAISRRGFLSGAAALGIGAHTHSLAGPARALFDGDGPKRSLVVIYLRGGADFLNMLIPYRDETYPLMRPGIGVSKQDGWIELDKTWALHPSLAKLAPLYESGHLAPIINVGSPHPTRSHFDAQDFMEYAAPGDRTVHSGWLNRYLAASNAEHPGNFRALGMMGLLPRSLRGEQAVLAVPESVETKKSSDALDRFEKLYGAESEHEGEDGMQPREEDAGEVIVSGKVTIETLRRFREIIAESKKSRHNYPDDKFGRGLERIAQVLAAGEELEIAGIDLPGWDHHVSQGDIKGRYSKKLRNMSASLSAFCEHLGPRLETTSILLMTEFGRTVAENGSLGTDHGHGGGMLLIGGGIKGGEVHGEWRGLKPDNLYQGRDLPVTTDFRDVMSEVLRGGLGFKAPRDFFPGYRPKRIKLYA